MSDPNHLEIPGHVSLCGGNGGLPKVLIETAWSIAEILVFDVVTWFELTLLAIGVFEALLVAGCTPRDSGGKKKMRGRR